MLSGVYQTEKEILYDIPYLWSLREQQSSDHKEKGADLQMQRTRCQSPVGRGGGSGTVKGWRLRGTAHYVVQYWEYSQYFIKTTNGV